jgi:hypothetical protein
MDWTNCDAFSTLNMAEAALTLSYRDLVCLLQDNRSDWAVIAGFRKQLRACLWCCWRHLHEFRAGLYAVFVAVSLLKLSARE